MLSDEVPSGMPLFFSSCDRRIHVGDNTLPPTTGYVFFFFFLSQFYCAEELSSYGAHAVRRVSNEERRAMYGTNQSLGTL